MGEEGGREEQVRAGRRRRQEGGDGGRSVAAGVGSRGGGCSHTNVDKRLLCFAWPLG